jgi:hypothetical protein
MIWIYEKIVIHYISQWWNKREDRIHDEVLLKQIDKLDLNRSVTMEMEMVSVYERNKKDKNL